MIRAMEIADVEDVLCIDQECKASNWNKQHFYYEIEENVFSQLYVLEEENEIVGFIGFWITFEQCQLTNIAIAKKWQGKGYSKVLMKHMIQKAQEAHCEHISLEVRKSNHRAQQLYRSFAFIEVNKRERYYTDNYEDAIIMVKGLGGE